MVDRKKILIMTFAALIAINLTLNEKLTAQVSQDAANTVKAVNPLELVGAPKPYLNNKVKISATFDKFSTLGLDYKPAFRDSKDYISFLIKRPDTKDHTIPLSELKLIVPRKKAEKLIELESGDQIELTGTVFSTALNDPWIDVNDIKILSSKNKIQPKK